MVDFPSNFYLILNRYFFVKAYCKSLIDTQWYCYDDANCVPIIDISSNISSVYNNGNNSVCTENAYILFYKRRDCMRNEKWWKLYIDRSLYDFDEFHVFLNNLEVIEKYQQSHQIKEQKKQLKVQQQNQAQIISKDPINSINKKANLGVGFKSLRSLKLLINSNSSTRIDDMSKTELSNQSKIVNNKAKSDFISKQDINVTNDLLLMNCYDEVTRPKRLLNQNGIINQSSSNISLNNGESCSSVSSSSLSKTNESPLSALNFKKLNFNSDVDQSLNLLNYPSDNDYTFKRAINYESDFYYRTNEPTSDKGPDTQQMYNSKENSPTSIQKPYQSNDSLAHNYLNSLNLRIELLLKKIC